MDDEQLNIKIEPITKENNWRNELTIEWNGQVEKPIIDIRLKEETDDAEPCLEFG